MTNKPLPERLRAARLDRALATGVSTGRCWVDDHNDLLTEAADALERAEPDYSVPDCTGLRYNE